jgi:hypothetical protein
MSKTKEAIERKFPRYRLGSSVMDVSIFAGESRIVSHADLTSWEAERIVRDNNAMLDALIEASELVVEIEASWRIEQPVTTTPKTHKRWRA